MRGPHPCREAGKQHENTTCIIRIAMDSMDVITPPPPNPPPGTPAGNQNEKHYMTYNNNDDDDNNNKNSSIAAAAASASLLGQDCQRPLTVLPPLPGADSGLPESPAKSGFGWQDTKPAAQ